GNRPTRPGGNPMRPTVDESALMASTDPAEPSARPRLSERLWEEIAADLQPDLRWFRVLLLIAIGLLAWYMLPRLNILSLLILVSSMVALARIGGTFPWYCGWGGARRIRGFVWRRLAAAALDDRALWWLLARLIV